MSNRNKTIVVAYKDGQRYRIEKHRHGWPYPRDPDGSHGGWVNGSWAFQTCIKRWQDLGYEVTREPNPLYRPKPLGSFLNFLTA
jgi:hypothetical protein